MFVDGGACGAGLAAPQNRRPLFTHAPNRLLSTATTSTSTAASIQISQFSLLSRLMIAYGMFWKIRGRARCGASLAAPHHFNHAMTAWAIVPRADTAAAIAAPQAAIAANLAAFAVSDPTASCLLAACMCLSAASLSCTRWRRASSARAAPTIRSRGTAPEPKAMFSSSVLDMLRTPYGSPSSDNLPLDSAINRACGP